MKLKPTAWRVYVLPIDFEEDAAMSEYMKAINFKIKAGMESTDERRAKVALTMGQIASVGPTAFKNKDWGWSGAEFLYGDPPKVGDKVWFGKYAGTLVMDPIDKLEYMLLNDEDIQSVIEG